MARPIDQRRSGQGVFYQLSVLQLTSSSVLVRPTSWRFLLIKSMFHALPHPALMNF